MSHALNSAELNWSIGDKELYTIVRAFITWRQWLLLAQYEIEVWCDHQNLSYFRKPQVLTARQARWYTTLQEYHFKTIHKAGTQNGRADALSRKEELNISEKMMDEVQVLWRLLVHERDRPKVLALCHDHAEHY